MESAVALATEVCFSWASLENKPFSQPVEPGKIPEGAGGFNPLKESLCGAFRHGPSPLFR
jgi:hypothetical protein